LDQLLSVNCERKHDVHRPGFKPKRILYRIIVPFTLLFAATSLLSWLFSAYFITRYLDQNLKAQMEQVVGTISKSSYIQNPAILRQIKDIVRADIVLFDHNGNILKSTFPASGDGQKLESTLAGWAANDLQKRAPDIGGQRYRTIVKPIVLPQKGSVFLSLWMPKAAEEHLKTGIILGIGAIALLGILAMAAVALFIAKTVTAPVEELANITDRIARGDLSKKAGVDSQDEIGRLADSFNHMIDQFKAFEEKLVESEKLATAGQLTAGLAHEIRNPLTSIKMLGQVLHQRLQEQPEDRKMLASLVKEIDRLDRIIQELIEKTNPGELSRAFNDLNDPIAEVLQVVEDNLHAQQISIEQHPAQDLPQVFADRKKIKGVIWNLVLNAMEAMPKGGRLIVTTGIADDAHVEISIEDTGPGIAAEDAEQLFQPFFTTKPEGMGLGLTMSRKIVEKHGGSLKLKNRPEGGTTASVMLPVK
jgi:signal transduction histidine kinase